MTSRARARQAGLVRAAAMILAAGLGSRLRPLSDELAKPLVPVGDEPLLARVARRFASAGAERAVVNLYHRPDDFERRAAWPLPLVFSPERELLGTAGGIARARTHFGGRDVIVWNGDIEAEVDLAALERRLVEWGAAAALAVRLGPAGTGAVGIGASGNVVRLRDARRGGEGDNGEAFGATFVGVSALGAPLVASLPERGCLVGDALMPLLIAGATIAALVYEGPFFDVGSPEGYLDANLAWLDRRGGGSFVGPGASVASGVELARCVLGAGAVVEGEGELRACVLWPGARVRAPLEHAIVSAGGLRLRARGA
ncbi:MAG: sugar phosphate nucleotidyltransferase [Polyangiaceae bacterium]|nr:sugar phosphate nucleotidyltransferase [Polyangiaceae bacterium]